LPAANVVPPASCDASDCVTSWQGSSAAGVPAALALGNGLADGEGLGLFAVWFDPPHAATIRTAASIITFLDIVISSSSFPGVSHIQY
jgi:hypothetical protein